MWNHVILMTLLPFLVLTVCAVKDNRMMQPAGFQVVEVGNGFDIFIMEKKIISHRTDEPFLFGGKGDMEFLMDKGNFELNQYIEERVGFTNWNLKEEDNTYVIALDDARGAEVELIFASTKFHQLEVTFSTFPSEVYDKLWLRLPAEVEENVYGGGEQFSHFNLRGRKFPMWVREQGVGRNKTMALSFLANVHGNGAGGDYHTTYFPQPTFVSSRHYYCHVESSNYIEMDFSHSAFHEVMILESPDKIHFNAADTMFDLLGRLTDFLGRQPKLPDWLTEGVIIGAQGGTEKVLAHLETIEKKSVDVVGLWIQDWSGKIFTSFGQRVFWNWEWDPVQYPDLDKEIVLLREQNVRFLAYINPHLNKDGHLYQIANEKGYFMKNSEGATYDVDFGEFTCGTVDFTNPEAAQWYKDVIIKKNLIELGFGGWMADFGEYTPVDAVFYNGMRGQEVHNILSVLFAKANREAVEEAGKLGEVMFYMRAGWSGTQQHSLSMWAGDQNVDWSYSDGLGSTIPAALSMGMSGFGITHFDIGGYTSVIAQGEEGDLNIQLAMLRTDELLVRGAEAAVFTPIMRTHEGNIPPLNAQVYDKTSTLELFAVYVNMFKTLAVYTRHLQSVNSQLGIPLQRSLFLHYANDPIAWELEHQYLYGEDLLVAPVLQKEITAWDVYLPADDWVSIYNDSIRYNHKTNGISGAWVTVDAPIGRPPVFYRSGSKWTEVFREVGRIAVEGIPQGTTVSTQHKDYDTDRFTLKYSKKMNSPNRRNFNTDDSQCEEAGKCP